MHKVLDNTNKSVLLFFEFIFATKVMNHYFENAIRLFMIVYILCNQIIGLNSKSSILWKLNEKSGKIDSYSNSHQHVSIRAPKTLFLNMPIYNPILCVCVCVCGILCVVGTQIESHIIAH